MHVIDVYNTAKSNLSSVKAFLGLIGKPQRTTLRGHGHLHSVTVDVKIYHQETDGAKNYHSNQYFNSDLEHIIKKRFPELAAEALKHRENLVSVAANNAREAVDKLKSELDAEKDAP